MVPSLLPRDPGCFGDPTGTAHQGPIQLAQQEWGGSLRRHVRAQRGEGGLGMERQQRIAGTGPLPLITPLSFTQDPCHSLSLIHFFQLPES